MQKLDLLPAGTTVIVGFELFPRLKGAMARTFSDEKFMAALFHAFAEKVDAKLLELGLCPPGELRTRKR
jgi:hypothetical protein